MRLALACLVATSRAAFAGAPTPADDAFERGRTLFDAGKLDEACAAFADSLRLDFQYGTLYSLGRCEEMRGRVFAAWQAYRKLADEDTNAPRRARAGELAAAVDKRVPRIVVVMKPGLEVAIDGQRFADVGEPQRLEVGSHEVTASAPGYRPWHTTITAAEGATVRVEPALEAVPAPVPVVERRRVRDFPVLGPTVTIAGGATFVAGVALVLHGRSLYDSSAAGAHAGDPTALADNRNAVRDGHIASALMITGLVAVPVGVLLWRHDTWIVTPQLDAHGSSVTFAARF